MSTTSRKASFNSSVLAKSQSMNRVLYQTFALFSWFSVLTFFPTLAHAEAADKSIVSRTAEVDGIQLHYLTAGRGPAVILLHGYAETSRMWRPIMPLLAEKFTVIAPDLRDIGYSSIPADNAEGFPERGIDMKASATRIQAVARSLGVEKAC